MNRGRVYQCSVCDYKGERKLALKHFRQSHVRPEENQFWCTLCNFTTHDRQYIKRHFTFYPAHKQLKEVMVAAGTYLGDDELYIKENSTPRIVDSEVDLRRWEAAESSLYWQSRKKESAIPLASISQPPMTLAQLPVSSALHPVIPTTSTITAPLPTTATSSTTTASTSTTSLTVYIATPIEPTRIVHNENILDQLLPLTDDTDDLFDMPEPLRSPPCTIPKPTLADIQLPITEEPSIPSSFSSCSSDLLQTLISIGKDVCQNLHDIKKQLERNHDQLEKIEIAVRRGYSNKVIRQPYRRPYHGPSFNSSSFHNRFNRFTRSLSVHTTPRKRKFVPDNSPSPMKKVKSAFKKSSKS